jgi:hypothetical protein
LKEAIAILAFTRQRNIEFMSGMFSAVSSENAEKAVRQFRGLVFPEEASNDALYLKKAKEMMRKLMTVDIRIKPTDASEERDFKYI